MNNIAHNLICSGCGVCSAACPKKCIRVLENVQGELRPVVNNEICVSCGKCKTVCPFINPVEPDETKLSVLIGTAPEFSENGSSGGVATYFLSRLLESKTVDCSVVVTPQENSNELFTYTLCKTSSELTKCQGSAYYPVTLYDILQVIEKTDGTFAVIGVPCFISALKNLKNSSEFWNTKLKILVGIVCGHTPNKHLVDCLALSSGHTRADITDCRFRIKEPSKPAWDYGVKLRFSDGQELKSFGSDDFGFLFWRKLFIQKCCNNCSDVFADNADITFMDAWLPEYKEKHTGTSLIICRNPFLLSLFNPLLEGGHLKETDEADIYLAQENLVKYKSNAGKHEKEEKLANKVYKLYYECKDKTQIIEQIRRLCYKENLKKKNPLLWSLLEIKDRLK